MTVHEKSCGVVVFYRADKVIKKDSYEFLLLHYPEGHWDLPKGHVEKGEEETTTALRELEEETGLKDVKVIEGFKHPIHYFFRKENELISKIVVFYLVEANHKKVKISFEHKDFVWLPYKEAIKKMTFKNAKEVVEKAYEFILDNIK